MVLISSEFVLQKKSGVFHLNGHVLKLLQRCCRTDPCRLKECRVRCFIYLFMYLNGFRTFEHKLGKCNHFSITSRALCNECDIMTAKYAFLSFKQGKLYLDIANRNTICK